MTPPKITGTTLINHHIRVKLKLSLQEYTILSFLSEWFKTNKNEPTPDNYMESIGCNFADEQVKLLYAKLIQKGFILNSKVSELWNKEFRLDLSAEFEKLWLIHKKGNKKTALERFNKVVKKVTFEELEAKLKLYIQTNDFQFLKGLDVYLNPKREHWNDPLVYKDGMKPVDKDNKLSGMVMGLLMIFLLSCNPKKEPPTKQDKLIDAIQSGSKLTKADAG